MSRLKKISGYILYTFFAFIFFLYLLFPTDKIKNSVLHTLNNSIPDKEIIINKIKTNIFPPGITLVDIGILSNDEPLFYAEGLNIQISLLSVFKTKKHFSYTINAYGGNISGDATISSDNFEPAAVNTFISGLSLDIPAIGLVNDKITSGILDGEIHWNNSNENLYGSGSTIFTVSNLQTDITTPFLSLKDVVFKTIELDTELKENKLSIKKGIITGDIVSGNISGDITLKANLGASRLNLKGTIKKISFTIKGTINKPSFGL